MFYIIKDCGNLVSVGKPPIATPQVTLVTKVPREIPAPQPLPVYTPPVVTPKSTTVTPTPTTVTPTVPVVPAVPVVQKCPYSPTIPLGDENCKPCQKSSSYTDTVGCVDISKTATNITVGGDANNTTVKAGDTISYRLYAKNNGKADVIFFSFQDNVGDVLDYADVVDLHGGTLDRYGNVSWPSQNIASGSTAGHEITVKVKDPIPRTPTDPANTSRFNLIMTNSYGNIININLPGSPTKQVELATAALPNTGPGTTMLIASAVVIMAGYFYSRASLLARESEIAIKETATA